MHSTIGCILLKRYPCNRSIHMRTVCTAVHNVFCATVAKIDRDEGFLFWVRVHAWMGGRTRSLRWRQAHSPDRASQIAHISAAALRRKRWRAAPVAVRWQNEDAGIAAFRAGGGEHAVGSCRWRAELQVEGVAAWHGVICSCVDSCGPPQLRTPT